MHDSVEKIVFRLEANQKIGFGHFFRCVNLAKRAKERSFEVCFWLQESDESAHAILTDLKFSIVKQLKFDSKFKWLVVDSYNLDKEWESRQRDICEKILVIDDYTDRAHDCDLYLNQNYLPFDETNLDGLLSSSARQLLGPKYILSAESKRLEREVEKVPKQIFVFMGGGDPKGFTPIVCRELVSLAADSNLHVVLGPAVQDRESIRQNLQSISNKIKVLDPIADLREFLSRMDLAVVAGGATLWDTFYAGVPTLSLIVAENQRPTNLTLEKDGFILAVNAENQEWQASFREKFSQVFNDHEFRAKSVLMGQELVDGKGVDRVLDAILGK